MGQVTRLPVEHPVCDEALEQHLCGWLVAAERAELAGLLDRLRPELCLTPLARALIAKARERVVRGEPTDAGSLYTDVREAGHPVSAHTIASWHVAWIELGTPGRVLIELLEDYERQRVARAIRDLPVEPTGKLSLERIRAELDRVPLRVSAFAYPLAEVIMRVEATLDDPEETRRLRTGMASIDHVIGGFKPGDLVVIGARTSVGKSVFAARIARGVSHATGRPVLLHTLEMTADEVSRRWIADVANVENWRVQRGQLTPEQRGRVGEAVHAVAGWPGLAITEMTGPFAEHLAAYEQWAAQHPAMAMLVVDYIGLIRGVEGAERRYQELGIVTHSLKALAKRLGIVVVAVSQLNRASAGGDRVPALHDLRESGDIEQDADIVLLLHVDESTAKDDEQELTVIVGKNRSGGLGTFTLAFAKRFCRIEERSEMYWG